VNICKICNVYELKENARILKRIHFLILKRSTILMKKFLILISIVSISLFSFAAQAGDAEAGKAKSVTCAACHGGEGISPTGAWPNLAGQKEEYLAAQMIAFRDGTRENGQMSPMAANLSDEDIANLAAYYASMTCK